MNTIMDHAMQYPHEAFYKMMVLVTLPVIWAFHRTWINLHSKEENIVLQGFVLRLEENMICWTLTQL